MPFKIEFPVFLKIIGILMVSFSENCKESGFISSIVAIFVPPDFPDALPPPPPLTVPPPVGVTLSESMNAEKLDTFALSWFDNVFKDISSSSTHEQEDTFSHL